MWRVAMALLLVAGVGAEQPAGKKKETPQQVVFRLTNEFRASQNLPPLKWNDTLARSAQKHLDAARRLWQTRGLRQ